MEYTGGEIRGEDGLVESATTASTASEVHRWASEHGCVDIKLINDSKIKDGGPGSGIQGHVTPERENEIISMYKRDKDRLRHLFETGALSESEKEVVRKLQGGNSNSINRKSVSIEQQMKKNTAIKNKYK